MPGVLTSSVRDQIAGLQLEASKPLIICDADEVLFQFIRALEDYLTTIDHYLDLKSFAISGNIKHRETHVPVPNEEIKGLLANFFAAGTRTMRPVDGAAEALGTLANHANIVILSNLPEEQRLARHEALEEHGMPYPVVANEGAKGAAARALSERAGKPVFFLDDLPPFITSVRRGVPDAHIIHFVGDKRLAALIGKAPDSDHRIDDWKTAHQHIRTVMESHGGLD